jgi:transcriptional antiterminator Rof (Rho-off)
MNNPKNTVDCAFYEELEWLSLRHKTCQIVFLTAGARLEISDQISDLYTRDAVEWLKTASGLEIRLLDLLEVDGKRPAGAC